MANSSHGEDFAVICQFSSGAGAYHKQASSTKHGNEMTVAKWEFWSVAVMLAETHGLAAEAFAAEKLSDAIDQGHSGDILTWREISERLPEILAKRYPPPA